MTTKSHIISKSQYGFWSNHLTVHATLEIIDRITNNLTKNETPFDNKYYGVTGRSLGLINDYLSMRLQYT